MSIGNAVKDTVYNQILYNPLVKKGAVRALNSSVITGNGLYNHLYNRRIADVMAAYHLKPACIKLETTNACNSHCIMCPHDDMARPMGVMSDELFTRVIDQAAALDVDHISMHNFGEPLIDKKFVERVRYAKSLGLRRVTTNTNASLLTENVSAGLIEAGLDEIFISIDAATKETFENIRVGLDYDKVESNVMGLCRLKKELGAGRPAIIVDYVDFAANAGERELFFGKWRDHADHVCISSLHNWGGQSTKDTSGGVHEEYVVNSGVPCRLLWTDLVINWDGSVPICCQDTDNIIVIGNAKESSIADLWSEPFRQELRRRHLDGEAVSISMCEECKLHTFWWMF